MAVVMLNYYESRSASVETWAEKELQPPMIVLVDRSHWSPITSTVGFQAVQ